ncbi:hypothetical protein AA313_de0206274 [Arthrobotrys entomopaga]|nr:hypothetical protein AA313_de0206274 [Arthrobotrys entomopaga]
MRRTLLPRTYRDQRYHNQAVGSVTICSGRYDVNLVNRPETNPFCQILTKFRYLAFPSRIETLIVIPLTPTVYGNENIRISSSLRHLNFSIKRFFFLVESSHSKLSYEMEPPYSHTTPIQNPMPSLDPSHIFTSILQHIPRLRQLASTCKP